MANALITALRVHSRDKRKPGAVTIPLSALSSFLDSPGEEVGGGDAGLGLAPCEEGGVVSGVSDFLEGALGDDS